MASVREKNGRWYYRITLTSNGKHKYIERGSYDTEEDALEAGITHELGDVAVKLAGLDYKIEVVDQCLEEVGEGITPWLKKCVVDGKSYNVLVSDGVPCGKEYFYQRYRLFFSRLNQVL